MMHVMTFVSGVRTVLSRCFEPLAAMRAGGPLLLAVLATQMLGGSAHAAKRVSAPFAVTGATVHTAVAGETPFVGTVLVKDGRVEAVVHGVRVPGGYRRVNARGMHVTPGLLDAWSHVGLIEVAADAQLRDHKDTTDAISPALQTIDGVRHRSRGYRVARHGGVSHVLVAPAAAAPVAGQSAVLSTREGPLPIVVQKAPAALHVTLGERVKAAFGSRGPKSRMGGARVVRDAFVRGQARLATLRAHDAKVAAAAAAGKDAPSAPAPDEGADMLARALLGQLPVVVWAHRPDDVRTALRLAEEFGFRLVIAGGAGAYRVAPALAAAKVPVILAPVRPMRDRDETRMATLENAARLHAAGVQVAVGSASAFDSHNLALDVGMLVAHGLPAEAGLAAMTRVPAAIYGLQTGADTAFGTLQKGAPAHIAVWNGPPLAPGSRVRTLFIAGEQVEDGADTADGLEIMPPLPAR